MSFTLVEVDNDGFQILDENGNPVSVVQDGSLYRLRTEALVHGAAKGVTPAADVTSTHINDDHQAVDVRNWGGGLGGSQEVEGLAGDGATALGNPVLVGGYNGVDLRGLRLVLDGTVYRLRAEAKVAKGASDLVHLDAIDTETDKGRLKTTIYTQDGDPVAFSAVPPNPASIHNDSVRHGGSPSLLVNGSVAAPVIFTYEADAIHDISIQEIKFVLVGNTLTFGSGAFGTDSGPLTNGVLVDITASGNYGVMANLIQNESFDKFSSLGGFSWVVASKDKMSSTYLIGGGLKLVAGSADKISVTVRDNITSAGVYFECFVKGNLLA